ncbi:MAG: large-conductance mechanosensitive channel protein MscL [Bacteroidia bacterium]|nr:large-conductance mechanosensitive channel protein MscL [Bacteroidia bacterium]
MIKEFREFIMRGNVLDLAVAVIIGGAFGKIVSSLVKDIIMPFIGYVTGGVNFTDLKYVLKEAVMEGDAVKEAAVTINYGTFVQFIVDFVLVAFVLFLIIKTFNKLQKKQEEEVAAAPPAPSKEETLLGEIRDILKAQNS